MLARCSFDGPKAKAAKEAAVTYIHEGSQLYTLGISKFETVLHPDTPPQPDPFFGSG
jgi:hypothetical protein